MTSAKDHKEIKRTQETYSRAKRLHATKKKIQAKVKEALYKEAAGQFSSHSHKPLLDLPPIPKHEEKSFTIFDSYDTYVCISLIGFGYCLAMIWRSV